MKTFVVAAILATLSMPAFADYFGCKLTVNGTSEDQEAEYHGTYVYVNHRGYECSGEILTDRVVSATIFSQLTRNSRQELGGFNGVTVKLSEVDAEGEGNNVVKCECGLR